MLIVGAKGHAKEIIEIIDVKSIKNLIFYDDVSETKSELFLNTFKIIHHAKDAKNYFNNNTNTFATAIGGTTVRKNIVTKLEALGGSLISLIDKDAVIGNYDVSIGIGANIMKNVMISNSVIIGKAALINYGTSIHHDVTIGDYCEISPRALLLGRCKIGNFVSLGSGCIILPDVEIGNNVIIGAGAVVTKNVKPNTKVAGIPAKEI